MKATFAKILGVVLVLSLVLSGCNLIEVDPGMQAQEDIKKLEKTYSATAATYDGGEVTVGEALGDFNTQYSNYYYMYQYYMGYTMTDEDVHELASNVLSDCVQREVIAAHFDETEALSDEELAQVTTDAQEAYQTNYDAMLESATGTDAEKDASTLVSLAQAGLDYDSVYNETLLNAKVSKMQEKVEGEITEVTDEELQAAYDEKVAADEATYSSDPGSLSSTMTSADAAPYWIPEGYRTVKHILLKPAEDVLAAYTTAATALSDAQTKISDLEAEMASLTADETTEATDEADEAADETAEATAEPEATEVPRTAEEIQADIDETQAGMSALVMAVNKANRACLQDVSAKTGEIYAKLADGASFDDLIAEYGEDAGMQNEPGMTTGYYVSAVSTNWQQSFTNASMALEKVGDYTTIPVVSGSGVHIIEYVSDVTAGAVSLEDVHDALYEETLQTKKDTHYSDTTTEWVTAVNASYDTDGFMAVVEG